MKHRILPLTRSDTGNPSVRLQELIVEAPNAVDHSLVFVSAVDSNLAPAQGMLLDPAGKAWFSFRNPGDYHVYWWEKNGIQRQTVTIGRCDTGDTRGYGHIVTKVLDEGPARCPDQL